MPEDPQQEIVAFLEGPEGPGGGDPVRRIDTHISAVFLAGDRAWKLKRARHFDYLDYSTPEARRHFCEAEVAVNRRTAPEIYLGVAPVRRAADGRLGVGAVGETPEDAIDWLVVMRRFDEDKLFDRLASRGALGTGTMVALADVIAGFHRAAAPRLDMGGRAAMGEVIAINDRYLREAGGDFLAAGKIAGLREASEAALAAGAARLEARREAGRVRHCHGDLHLRNIVMIDGGPRLFDAIEFSESLACVDVLYDLAFLLMDLEHRGQRLQGNVVFNRYLALTGERDGLALLPLFLSSRAAIRAHVTATAARAGGTADRPAREAGARAYLDLALAFLSPPPARLVAVGGLSGSGKSTLGAALAPDFGRAPGALHLRSDQIRKELAGVDFLTRLGPEAYSTAMTDRVYGALAARAGEALAAGQAVVADAVFAGPEQRRDIAAVAGAAGVAFDGLWLEAPLAALEARVGGREGDTSDADVAVVRTQSSYETGPIRWHRVDASGDARATATVARAILMAGY